MEELTGLIDATLDWAKQPFNAEGSVFNWILFVGLLSVAAWWWWHIINSITE
jgi:hypothetical protein